MTKQLRVSKRRSPNLPLSLEILEDRLVPSGWGLSGDSLPVIAASPPASSGQAATNQSYGDQTGGYPAGMTQEPARASSAATSSSYPPGQGTDNYPATSQRAGSDTAPGATATANRVAMNYAFAGSLYGAGAASRGLTESAYTNNGQQSSYRLPADQSGASHVAAPDLAFTSVVEALASTLAGQGNARAVSGTLDATSRRNAETAAPAPGGALPGPTVARSPTSPDAAPAADVVFAEAAADPGVKDTLFRLASAPLFGALLPTGQIAAGRLPVDLAALERGAEQFFNQIGALGDQGTNPETAQRLAPWLVVVGLSTAALEMARWHVWKPAPSQPLLLGRTRAAAGPPDGADPPVADVS